MPNTTTGATTTETTTSANAVAGTAGMNVALAADFTLFKSKMTAMFLKEAQGIRFLVIPVNQGDAPIVTLDELIGDIKKMAGEDTNTDAIEESLKNAADEGTTVNKSEITFQLKMLYLYVDTTQGAANQILEYAFNVNVMTGGLIPKALSSIVTVDHLGVAVWNTSRENILSKMSIVDINAYLGIPKETDSGNSNPAEEPKAPEVNTEG